MALTTQQIQTAYVTFFSRPADVGGLNYWSDYAGSEADLYTTFAQSKEYADLFDGKSSSQKVAAVYQNLFGRAPEAEGLNYWTLQLDKGTVSVANLALTVAAGAQTTDKTILENRVTAATTFTASLDTGAEILAYQGDAANAVAKQWLAGVTDDASLKAAVTVDVLTSTVTQMGGSNTGGQPSQNFTLTVGQDTLKGTTANDTFVAKVVQNVNGEQTNQLATGDSINGGAGVDTLNAVVQTASALNNSPASAITPETVDVEVANFTALSVNESATPVTINAKFMNGLDKVGSVHSDVDLVVQNLNTLTDSGVYAERRNTKDLTIKFDHGSNDAAASEGKPADLVALFDNDYLLSGSTSSSTLELRMVNNLTLADNKLPLKNVESVAFFVNGVQVETKITAEIQALEGVAAYAALVDAIKAQLTKQGISGVEVSTLAARTTVFSDDVGTHTQGEQAGQYIPVLVSSAGSTLVKGETKIDSSATDFNGLNTQLPLSSTSENQIEVGVELTKVGRGGEGGELVIGGMATDFANKWKYTGNAQEEGIEVFNVKVDGDNTQFSSLAGLYSTNNTLDTVNVAWATGSVADLIIGNQNTKDNRSVSPTIVAPNGAALASDVDGFGSVTTMYNHALKDVRVFSAANNNVADGKGNTADVTLHAHLSDEVVAKYMDRKDVKVDAAADNADFAYTFGAGNDSLNLNISKANLAASGTTNREDFTLKIDTGAGNDKVVVQIGDGKGVATDAWYVNSKIQKNLKIDTGAGDDTVHVNGAGVWNIKTGQGNDVVYSDNSGRQDITTSTGTAESNAVWVFNTANQAQGGVQNLFDLTSAGAVANATKIGNLSLKLSFRGIEVTVEVGNTHTTAGDTVNDLTINQAIKKAINENVYLSKLLTAEDGPGRTLIVTSKTDGAFSDADISIDLITKAVTTAQATAGVAEITTAQLGALGFDTTGVVVADGRFDSAITEDNASVEITGAASAQANANVIESGAGNDVVVLSSSTAAEEKLVYSGYDLGKDVIVNFTAGVVGTVAGADKIDFSAYLTSKIAATGALDAQAYVPAAASVTVTANDIAVISFTAGSGTTASQTFDGLSAENFLAAIKNTGTVTYGSLGSTSVESGAVTGLVNNLGKAVVLVENAGNFGEYKAFELSFTTAGAATDFTEAKLIGVLDFGSTQTFDETQFTA